MRIIPLVFLLGCAVEQERPVSIALASPDPTPVGEYRDGILQLDPAFATAFELADDIDSATTQIGLAVDIGDKAIAITDASAVLGAHLAEGDTLHLVVTAGSETVDDLLLVVDSPSFLESTASLCTWQYTTTSHRGTCTLTVEYWKHSSCARTGGWERFGGATWKSGC